MGPICHMSVICLFRPLSCVVRLCYENCFSSFALQPGLNNCNQLQQSTCELQSDERQQEYEHSNFQFFACEFQPSCKPELKRNYRSEFSASWSESATDLR